MKEGTEDFNRNIGDILRVGLDVETELEFFISNYFVKPRNAKIFFLNDIIVSELNFEKKKNIFKEICEREEFDKKEVSEVIKSITFVQHKRNIVAHWEAESLSEGGTQLRKRKSYTTNKDILKIDKKLVKDVKRESSKAIKGIVKFYLIYYREGTIDERESNFQFSSLFRDPECSDPRTK